MRELLAGMMPLASSRWAQIVWSLRSGLARDSAAAFALRVAWAATAFLAQVVAARVLGVEGFGVYAYVLAWLYILPFFAMFGLNNTTLRFASTYRSKADWGRLRGLERYTERRVLLAGLVITAAGWGILALLGERISAMLAQSMAIGLLAVPVLALLFLRAALLRALGHIVAALTSADVLRHGFVLITLAVFGVTLPGRIGSEHALSLTLVGALLSLAVISIVLQRARPNSMRRAQLSEERAEWRSTALPFLLFSGSHMILSRTDVLMLGWLMDTTAAGTYTAALRLADLTGFALAAINVAASPAIASAASQGDQQQLQAMATWTARTAFAAALVGALPIGLFAYSLLGLSGEAFLAGADALRLLLLGQVVHAATGSAGYLLAMAGRERDAALVVTAAAAQNVLLNAVLISSFGLVGAALATMITTLGCSLAMAAMVWRRLAIVPGPIPMLRRKGE